MKNLGVWVGALILVFAGVIFWQSLTFDYYSDIGPGPGLFPLWLSGILTVLSLLYIVDSLKRKIFISDVMPKGQALGKVLRISASVVLFILIAPFTGFTLAGIVVLFILFFGEMTWYGALCISTVTTVLLFLLFKSFLGVPLPVNALGW